MEKKKNNKILIIIGIIILVIAVYFICFHRGTTEENKKALTVAEEITLNDSEKELLAELVNVNDKMLNPTQEESTNTTDYTKVAKPTQPTSLKDFCIKLYEARKTTNEQGETIYLFDMETKGQNGESVRRKIITRNGEMTGVTFVENDYAESLEQMEDTNVNENGITLGKEFMKTILEGLTQKINEIWESATIYENVNYNNILSKI